ncbi:heavy-metal-associated domain-containing protein [Streptomyces sp. NBC_00996]|nr:heavy-metal-associated domain-containing protein [Streptomyces sp. NBC_00996]
MTCAACVRRVEKRLGKLEGVTATVNTAVGTAQVSHPPRVRLGELVATVERPGTRPRCRGSRTMSSHGLDAALQSGPGWRAGDLVPFTLRFRRGGWIKIVAPVGRPGERAP